MIASLAMGSALLRVVVGGVLLALGVVMYGAIASGVGAENANMDFFLKPKVLALTVLPAGAGSVMFLYGLTTFTRRTLRCTTCGHKKAHVDR